MAMTPYEVDYYAWTQEQAAALRAGILTEADFGHIAEEIEEMGGSELGALESNLSRVIEHLIKWQYSPATQSRRGWRRTIAEHRQRVAGTLARSGSLRARCPELLARCYRNGRKLAIIGLEEDGIDMASIPAGCPYTLAQVVDEDWYPGG